jgi:hypothetical protein
MFIIERRTKKRHAIVIEQVKNSDYQIITKGRYFFDWKTEKPNDVYKLRIAGNNDILGLISLIDIKDERRIEINLLAVSRENRGRKKQYDRVCGTLIGFACREAVKQYGINACVSLIPKTKLKKHYISIYGMMDAGRQVFLEGELILNILNTYDL